MKQTEGEIKKPILINSGNFSSNLDFNIIFPCPKSLLLKDSYTILREFLIFPCVLHVLLLVFLYLYVEISGNMMYSKGKV